MTKLEEMVIAERQRLIKEDDGSITILDRRYLDTDCRAICAVLEKLLLGITSQPSKEK